MKRVRFDPLIIIYNRNQLKFPLLESAIDRMSRIFYSYGKFCASRPWEVMISFLTLSICLFSLSGLQSSTSNGNVIKHTTTTTTTHDNVCTKDTVNCNTEEDSIDAVYVMIIARCLAVLYICHSFTNLYKLGSKYLTGIAVLFSLFSSFFFCTGVINFLNADFNKLGRALTFFFLLMDLPKAVLLAQYALSSRSREDISENIAQGMVILGPTLTLDTSLKLLSIGIGTISKVGRMEELIFFAFLSVIVNYIIFMIFLPACLSLALELSHDRDNGKPSWQLRSLSKVLQLETERATNPVIQRVKLIMSVGLMLIHIISRWPISEINDSLLANSSSNALNQLNIVNSSANPSTPTQDQQHTGRHADASFFEHHFHKWFTISFEQLVLFGLVFVLITKYIYDSKENLEEEVRAHQKSTATNEKSLSPQRNSTVKSNNKGSQSNSPQRKISPTIVITQSESQTLLKSLATSLNGKVQNKSTEKRKSSLKNTNKENNKFFIGASGDDSSDGSEDSVEQVDKEIQTDESNIAEALEELKIKETKVREFSLLVDLLNSEDGLKQLTDQEILVLVEKRKIPPYKLESILGDPERGVKIRRMYISKEISVQDAVFKIPYTSYDYSLVMGACCENVIGYMPVPLGTAGPLLLDGKKYQVPMATTEGCLVASTNRGCRALSSGGCTGVSSSIFGDNMTRGPVVRFQKASRAVEASDWINKPENRLEITKAFNCTTRFGKLETILCRIAGRELFIRFGAKTGDAMGMNMISKGTESALKKLQEYFPDMEIVSLSGNFCTDKKPSAVNWIEGRGKSVVCEAIVPAKVVREVLKTDVKSLVSLNISKNLVGSAIAGSIGGLNAHAANIVAAIYIATGQDPAQVVGSSNCMTLIEEWGENNEDLYITCTMPSIELGTIGGGTILEPQASCLDILGVRSSCAVEPGRNAKMLARIVCATVLAAELSLLSALAAGTLVKSHMKHNRSSVSINASSNNLISSSPPNLSTFLNQKENLSSN